MAAASIFFIVIFMIPLYGVFIWMYVDPEESIRSGRRWMYREDPEISEEAIHYTKFSAVAGMIGIPIVLASIIVNLILKIYILRLLLIVVPIVLIIVFVFGAAKAINGDE